MECSCSVLSVRPFSGYYPGCPRCSRKTTAANGHCSNRLQCTNCSTYVSLDEITWTYCVAMTISDGHTVCDVTAFGPQLNTIFGIPAGQLRKYLMKWFVGYNGLSPYCSPSLSHIMMLAMEGVLVNKHFKFHFRISDNSEVIKRTSLSEVLKARGRGQGHASSGVGGASLVTSHVTPISQNATPTVFQMINHFVTDKENIPEPHPLIGPHPLSETHPINLTNQDSSNNSTFYNHLCQDSKDHTSLLAPPIYFNSICQATPTLQQSHSFISSLKLNTGCLDNSNYGNTSEQLALNLLGNEQPSQQELQREMERDSPCPPLNHTPSSNHTPFHDHSHLIDHTHLSDHTPSIISSLIEWERIIDDIKGEWLLTQEPEPHVSIPIIDHNTSCDTPFWRCVPSTQAVLQGEDGCGQATSSGCGSHSSTRHPQPHWPHPQSILTPQLHRTLIKRTLISAGMPRPHSLGTPDATSTPSVTMVTGRGKDSITNSYAMATTDGMGEMSRELFVNYSNDNEECMSPDIL